METLNTLLLLLTTFSVACAIVLAIVVYKLNVNFCKERKDYINRIVARSNNEYIVLDKNTSKVQKELSAEDILGADRKLNGILN